MSRNNPLRVTCFPVGADAHELALVGAVEDETVGHQVAFCYLDLVRAVVVREGTAQLGYVSLELFGQVGSHELVEGFQISSIYGPPLLLERALFSSSTDMLLSS